MRIFVPSVAAMLLLAGAAGTLARPAAPELTPARGLGPAARLAPRQDGNLTLDRAVEIVQRQFAARVVRADEGREGADVVYRIRLLSADGRVFTVRVNARTGSIDQ